MLGEFMTVPALIQVGIISAGRCSYQQNFLYWNFMLFSSENVHLEKLPEACIMLFFYVERYYLILSTRSGAPFSGVPQSSESMAGYSLFCITYLHNTK
jgi:hypothetical protein